jgi:hypothetical protein
VKRSTHRQRAPCPVPQLDQLRLLRGGLRFRCGACATSFTRSLLEVERMIAMPGADSQGPEQRHQARSGHPFPGAVDSRSESSIDNNPGRSAVDLHEPLAAFGYQPDC